MDAEWITSPSARRVLQHADDSRPAWLWSHDGQLLVWENAAAGLFLAKLKKHGLKRAPTALPIKGQIARNIRLGSPGRTSLARIQFIAGEKPGSVTCATTPLLWQDGQMVLLVVGVDAIGPDILAAARAEDDQPSDDKDANGSAALDDEGVVAPVEAGSTAEAAALVDVEPALAADGAGDAAAFAADEDHEDAPPALDDQQPQAPSGDGAEHDLNNWRESEQDQPMLVVVPDAPAEQPEAEAPADPDVGEAAVVALNSDSDSDVAPSAEQEPEQSRLSRLFDQLATDEDLFTPLTDADDALMTEPETLEGQAPVAAAEAAVLFRVTGRGFVADEGVAEDADMVSDEFDAQVDEPPLLLDEQAAADALTVVDAILPETSGANESVADAQIRNMEAALAELAPRPVADSEAVERASRYNFDELARILTDRVGEANKPPAVREAPQPSGALINLGGETLVLNRLPLGILVFRDQQVLFANRAITEMVGYGSVESLRAAGLAAVFPAAGPEGQDAGPVNHLVQQDGTLVPVTARLQSISWQGRPALMLSASATEVRTGHEAAVRAFAQSFADLRGDGFFETTRAGVISAITAKATALLSQPDAALEGKALSALTSPADIPALREFLERPARFADTARPCLTARAATGRAEMILFAQGQAGVITGYFGFVRSREVAPLRISGQAEADPGLLARISRGVRRPLNTIIGFSDLIRSEAFGPLANERYEGYAQDIAAAGQEIALLVDELDDYARLRDGRYLPQRASIDLTALLESCVLRIRNQANGARVIVRNAISENLPKVTADRASLAQAVLNLLASAIDQTPTGGAVVISAQREDDGGISVHVRDSSTQVVDMAERFVVFRDGVGRDGQAMVPVRSSVGLALTRSLLAVNTVSLSVDPAGELGMLFTLAIPADLVERSASPGTAE